MLLSLIAGLVALAAQTRSSPDDKDISTTTHVEKTVDYGAYTVPPRTQNNGMLRFKQEEEAPCTECLVTFIAATIEYTNGTTADATNGMWMHHASLANKVRLDGICGEEQPGERFFGAGNDRNPLDLTIGGTHRMGYAMGIQDKLLLSAELMNMNSEPQDVRIRATWRYIPSTSPLYSVYKPATPYWMSVSGCVAADMPAASNSKFTYVSPSFRLSKRFSSTALEHEAGDARRYLAWLGNHIHDGASLQTVSRNGELICSSTPEYSAEAGVDGIAHFEHVPFCQDVGLVRESDSIVVTVEYDTTKWKPMVNEDGTLEGVMGIALAWVVDSDPRDNQEHAGSQRYFWVALGIIMLVTTVLLVGWFTIFRRREVLYMSLPS